MSKNNKSECKGVTFNKSTGKWISRININKKSIWLGSFISKDKAIESRVEAEKIIRNEIHN